MGHSVSSLESATEKHPNLILFERLFREETWKGQKACDLNTLHNGAIWRKKFRWLFTRQIHDTYVLLVKNTQYTNIYNVDVDVLEY